MTTDKVRARQHIGIADIVTLIIENNFYDIKLLTYDSGCKKILYDGKPFRSVDVEALRFEMQFERYTFNYRCFSKALYCLAMMNTPDIMEENPLLEPIVNWLDSTNREVTSTREVMEMVFKGKVAGLSFEQLQYRVANVLRQLGWQKRKGKYGVTWHKP